MSRRWLGIGALLLAGTLLSGQSAPHSRPELLSNVKIVVNDEEAAEWLTYYYLHPRPDLMVSSLDYLSQQGYLQKQNTLPALSGFLGRLFAADPSLAKVAVEKLGRSDQKVVVSYAVWLSKLPNTTELLDAIAKDSKSDDVKSVTKELLYREPPKSIKGELNNPADVDALWGAFFATGDPAYVTTVISGLSLKNDDNDANKAIGVVAESSLAINASQHPRVMQICEKEMTNASEPKRQLLAAVIERAKSGLQPGNH